MEMKWEEGCCVVLWRFVAVGGWENERAWREKDPTKGIKEGKEIA